MNGLNIAVKLKDELERLKKVSNLGFELDVVWTPNSSHVLAGEVRGRLVHVYEQDEVKAIETLQHEFLCYSISKAIEPFKSLANQFVKSSNAEAYKRKEEVVEGLRRLLSEKVTAEEVSGN